MQRGTGASISNGDSVASSGHALKIIGNPESTATCAYQDIPVNLPGSKTYLLSGWVKANAVPDNWETAEDPAQDLNKQCGLRAILTYSDDSTEYHYVPFNTNLSTWQFVSYTLVPKEADKTVSNIRIVCAYEGNANVAYFDNISLLRQAAQIMRYDDDGNLVSVTSTDLSTDVDTYENGNLIKSVTGGYGTFEYTYDETYTHRLISATNGQLTQVMGYDGVGNVTSTTLSGNGSQTITTSAAYDSGGNRLLSVTDATGATVSYAYADANSQMMGLPTSVTAPNGTVTATAYDTFGRVTQTSVDDLATLRYTYDEGNLDSIIRTYGQNNTQTYSFEYTEFGQTTQVKVGERVLASYTYAENNGLLTQQTYGNGYTVDFTYDDLGRTKTVTYDDETTVTYIYNGEGAVYSITEEQGTNTTLYLYTYDSIGRLIGCEKKINGETVLRTYQEFNEHNQLTVQGWQMGDTAYSENYTYHAADGSLNTHTTAAGQTLTMGYDGLRRLSSVTGGVYGKTYIYRDLADSKTTMQVAGLTYNLPTDLTYSYTYDSMGNIATYTDVNGTVTYTYDAQNQLLSAVNGDTTYAYTYDTAGNILSGNGHTYTYGDADWKDLLTKVDGQEIVYEIVELDRDNDGIIDGEGTVGNPISYYNGTRWTFSWSNGRQLATATAGDINLSFTYDADGLRTSKTVNGVKHTYYYAGGRLLRESFGGNTLDFFYDSNGNAYAVKYNGVLYYYITNLQGDVMSIVDGQGAVVASYNYDPYGNILTATGDLADINPLRYRGYVYDSEISLYYVSSRYYDPEIGRFINADDIDYLGADGSPLSNNLFAYCTNNPVNRFDVNGNWSLPNWAKVVIGAVATVAAVAVTVATGGAAAPVLIGVAVSTIGGAAVSAVNHRVTTGSWEGAGKAALDGAADGFMTGGLCALGGSVVGGAARTIKNAKSGITIGKMGTFEDVAALAKTGHYSGLKEFNFIKNVAGQKAAETIGWWQNKCVVKGVMALKGAIYDCGGALTGAYAKEVALTKGYQYLYNIWLM